MARVFITGSADGLGRAAARTLLDDGHEVVVHARTRDRLTAVRDLLDQGAAAVVGDLSDLDAARGVADQVNRFGPMDAVIHNAGVYTGPHVLAVNVVAPYLLTALLHRPQRLIYLSSSEHFSGRPNLTAIDWSGHRSTGSYPDSKLFVTTLAAAIARIWAQAALGDSHALLGPQPDEVGLEASNSATMAKTLNSNLPTASWGSYTDAPKRSRTCRAVSSSARPARSDRLAER
jgi:NAD(P)-dependent dehydrogenase (short-subunit alcohol dehydrogenase family)